MYVCLLFCSSFYVFVYISVSVYLLVCLFANRLVWWPELLFCVLLVIVLLVFLPFGLLFCLSYCLSVYLIVWPSVRLSAVCLPVCRFTSVCLSVSPSVRLSVCLSDKFFQLLIIFLKYIHVFVEIILKTNNNKHLNYKSSCLSTCLTVVVI